MNLYNYNLVRTALITENKLEIAKMLAEKKAILKYYQDKGEPLPSTRVGKFLDKNFYVKDADINSYYIICGAIFVVILFFLSFFF